MDIITVDRLFLVSKPFKLGEQDMVARALSSADLRVQQQQASLAGLRMKQAMDNKGSDEYAVRVEAGLAFGTDDQLRQWIDIGQMKRLESEAFKEFPLHFDPYPDDATEEDRQLALAKREETINTTAANRSKLVVDGLAAWQAKTSQYDRAKLEEVYTLTTIKNAIDTAWQRAFENASLLYGIRLPDGSAYFNSLAEVEAVPDYFPGGPRELMLAEVRSVNDIDPLHLSLPSSTDSPAAPGPSSLPAAEVSTAAVP